MKNSDRRSGINQWRSIRICILRGAVLIFVLGFLVNIGLLVIPLYTLQLFDRVMNSQSVETLYMLIIACAFVCIIVIAFDILRRRLPPLIARHVTQIATDPLIEDWSKLQTSQAEPHQALRNPGTLLTKFQSLLLQPSFIQISDSFFAPLFIAVLLILHPWLGVTMLLANTANLMFALIHYQDQMQSEKKGHQVRESANSKFEELYQQLPYARISQNQHVWRKRVQVEIKTQLQHDLTMNGALQGHLQFCQLIKISCQLIIPSLGTLLLIQQQISIGQLIAAMIISMRSLLPFELMIAQWTELRTLRDLLTEIKLVILKPQQPRHKPLGLLKGDISITTAEFANKASPSIVTSINIQRGSLVALIGPSGSGKSALLKQCMGLISNQDKAAAELLVTLDKHQPQQLDTLWIAPQVGHANATLALPDITIREFITQFQPQCDEQLQQATEAIGLHDQLVALPQGYDSSLKSAPEIRQRDILQRLYIARAIFHKPRYVFFDEVETNLDHNGEMAFINLLEQLQRSDTTVIFATQRRALLQQANNVLLLDRGIPSFFGNPSQLNSLSKKQAPINLQALRRKV